MKDGVRVIGDVSTALARYRDFEDASLVDVRVGGLLSELELVLIPYWVERDPLTHQSDGPGEPKACSKRRTSRSALETHSAGPDSDRTHVHLRFRGVDAVSLKNPWGPEEHRSQMAERGLNWGPLEVAIVETPDDEEVLRDSKARGLSLRHLRVRFDIRDDRWIDVVYDTVEALEHLLPEDSQLPSQTGRVTTPVDVEGLLTWFDPSEEPV